MEVDCLYVAKIDLGEVLSREIEPMEALRICKSVLFKVKTEVFYGVPDLWESTLVGGKDALRTVLYQSDQILAGTKPDIELTPQELDLKQYVLEQIMNIRNFTGLYINR